jgi:PAS domain S-box-containing protein
VTHDPPAEHDAHAAARLAVEQARAALALDAAELGEFEWDATADIFIVSPRMARITGMPEGEHPAERGEYALAFVHADDRDPLRELITERLTHEARYHAEYRFVRPDDRRVRWMESFGVIVRLPDGEPLRMIGVVRDVTERKAAEGARETLVAELDHRVKNVLASVQSLAAQSARRTTSIDSFLKTFTGRLQAMASAHTLLSRTRWRGAEIGDVVTAELGPLAHGRARWSGPALVLTPRATNALAIALHELATNAIKYGALSTDSGRVDARWASTPDGGFEMVWTERRGPLVQPPTRQGFGTMLLERVTGRELGGGAEVEFRPEGLKVTLRADIGALAPPDTPAANIAAADAGERHAASESDETVEIAGLKVLIVEDALLLALELEAALVEAGAEVLGPAGSVDEAMEFMDQAFDVVLLDADLNGQSAAPVAAALAKAGRPFILATGHNDAAALVMETPAATVRKPYNVRQIALAIAKAAGRLSGA